MLDFVCMALTGSGFVTLAFSPKSYRVIRCVIQILSNSDPGILMLNTEQAGACLAVGEKLADMMKSEFGIAALNNSGGIKNYNAN